MVYYNYRLQKGTQFISRKCVAHTCAKWPVWGPHWSRSDARFNPCAWRRIQERKKAPKLRHFGCSPRPPTLSCWNWIWHAG